MEDYTYLIPKDKSDDSNIDELNTYDIDRIRTIVPQLLEWLQDGNWPIANRIASYFQPRINKIEDEILAILNTNDEIWKYYILLLILHANQQPGRKIMEEVSRIAISPKPSETEEELDEIARDIVNKFFPNV